MSLRRSVKLKTSNHNGEGTKEKSPATYIRNKRNGITTDNIA